MWRPLSFVIFVSSGVAWTLVRQFNMSVTKINVFGGSGSDIDGKDQNILMVGDDSRAGATKEELAELGTDDNAGENTDTMMVLHVPADGSKATIISFPRDSWVNIPGARHGQAELGLSVRANRTRATKPAVPNCWARSSTTSPV